MASTRKEQLKSQVIRGAREYGIGSVLFRHAVGSKMGLSATDMECLGLIYMKGFSTPSEVSKNTGLSSGATTALLDRLEKSGLIERRANPDDRRSSLIVIVEETAQKLSPMFASVRESQDALMSRYTEAELEVLADFFARGVAMWDEEREKLKKKQAE